MYTLIVYKLHIIRLNQGSRIIKKRYFEEIDKMENIPKKDLTSKYLELKKIYFDYIYIIDIIKKDSNVTTMIEDYNSKSKKYIELIGEKVRKWKMN